MRTLIKNRRTSAVLLRENPKTVICRLPDGNIVKRHKRKHEVSL